jgi:hypothetical protein
MCPGILGCDPKLADYQITADGFYRANLKLPDAKMR